MRYVGFHIKNFKGIEEVNLDLTKIPNPPIFTFVGLNESGKTTILEALNFFKNDSSPEKSFRYIPKKKKANFNDSISVKASLILDESDEAEIKRYAKKLNFKICKLVGSFDITKSYDFESSKYKETKSLWNIEFVGTKGRGRKEKSLGDKDDEWDKLVDYVKEKMLPKIIYYPNFLFDFPPKIHLEPYANEDNKQPVYRQILQDILDFLDDNLDLNTHLITRIRSEKEEDKESLNALVDKMSSQVTKKIFDAWETMFNKKIRKEIIFQVGKDEKGDFIEVKLKENDEKYNIEERSLGFRWFFTFLLFTEFRKNRDEDPGETLFLLDEPAYNLHSTAQMKLLNTFEKLAENCKLVYTTHSHHLIEPKWLGGAFIIKNNTLNYDNEEEFNSDETDIKSIPYKQFVAKNPNDTTYFQPILDKLDYQPSLLEEVPNIAIGEGKSDYYTFKYIKEVILGDESNDINFYPGNGVDKLESIFRLYLAWGRDFVGIFDADTGGKRAKLNYTKKIGPEVESKVFTLNELNPEWDGFTTESLFNEEERKQIIKTVFGTEEYNKSKFNNAIQQLYIDKTSVELSEETLDKFKKIFEFIKGNL
jgi:AAA15 family ATPase/GTPase